MIATRNIKNFGVPLTELRKLGQHDGMGPSHNPEESRLLKKLGIEPHFADEAQAPPVDHEKLDRFRRGELDADALVEVRDCIATFRSWYQAYVGSLGDRGADTSTGDRS